MNTVDDWQVGKSLPDRMLYMLQNEVMCDVTFRVGTDKTEMKAHKNILACASSVFSRMFLGQMIEKGDILIPDIEPSIFRDMLRFIYTDKADIDADTVIGILYASEKYNLQILKELCVIFLSTNVNDETACVVFNAAHNFNLDILKSTSLQYIFEHADVCLQSKSFLSMSKECVKLVIKSNALECGEEIIYENVLKWANQRCEEKKLSATDDHIRTVLGDPLYCVRFPLIQRKYFTDNISKRSILTSSEIISIYQSYDGEQIELFDFMKRNIGLTISSNGIFWNFSEEEINDLI